ncbi:MAG: enoyl-CoA hydratase [Alteromonadaceae bacterium]|nr:enoyl-CoA hydratase [Alteromonadaceae bacterium]
MTAQEQIIVTQAERVTMVTLNRPDRMNAWTRQMAEELRHAVGVAGRDPGCRVIVITGAGRGFCAGADMGGLQDTAEAGAVSGGRAALYPEDVTFPGAPGPDLGDSFPGRFGYLMASPKPVIAAINGACAGIGLALALHCDLRYAAASAKFSTSFAARGLIAEHGLAWLLPRLVGEAAAFDLLLTARKFDGAEAARLGLVNRAAEPEALSALVAETAHTLAHDVSPRSLAVIRRQLRLAHTQSYAQSLALADAEMEKSLSGADFAEGVKSFVERRPAAFPDLEIG